MAGDAGLLEYDGTTWNSFRGSKGYTRSLLVMNDSLIYSGSDLDFGVWHRDPYQQFHYTSLYPFSKDPSEENEEFWQVHGMGDDVVFVSFNNIYLYKNKQLTKIAAPHRFAGSFRGKENVYLADEKEGLLLFNGISLKPLFRYPKNGPFQISGVHERPEGLLIVTKNNGVFRYQSGQLLPIRNDVSDRLRKDQVFCSIPIDDTYYAHGTILNGLYITDIDGNIVQHINKKKGLPNNTILSIHYSPNGLLWLGMDYGISAIHLRDSLTYFFDYTGAFGTASTAFLKDGYFYLGTNQGLYKAAWRNLNNDIETNPFTLIRGSEGQVWTLDTLENALYCGHDKGLFAVNGNSMKRLYSEPGVWSLVSYLDKYLLTGNYNGVSVFIKEGNTCKFLKKLELILGSCNQLTVEKDSVIWVNIPNFGLIRFALDANFFPKDRTIFPASDFSGNAPFILKDESGIQVLTDERRYLFEPSQKKFIPKTGSAATAGIRGLLRGVYLPVRLDENHEFYPVYNGFALKNTPVASQRENSDFSVLIRNVEAFNNQTRQRIGEGSFVPYWLNNIRFQFVVAQQNDAQYQYQLLRYSHQWSTWTSNTTLDFLHLREGDYVLNLRAKVNGIVTPVTQLKFYISPPWYRTWWAFLGYLLLAALIVYLIWQWQNARLNKQKNLLSKKEQLSLRKLADKYEQEALLRKQQQLEYEKDLLEQQVKQKNIALAKQAKDNQNKNRLLHILKEKMEEAQHEPALGKMRWAEMKRLLDLYLETDDKTFEIQIDELHQAFFKKMREQFPDLSLYDLRLCAYLKIGLNSKEIAELLKVLPSSINVSRSRLRKKLNLKHDDDLYGFLNRIQ